MLQAATPDRILGRAFATHRFISWGVIPIGAFLGGVLGTHLGLRTTLWIGSAGAIAGVLWLIPSPFLAMRDLPDADQ